MLDMNWTEAEAGHIEALALNPSNEFALRAYGVMLALLSRFEEAARHVDRACEIDPLCLMANTAAAWVRYVAGDLDRAIGGCEHTLHLLPDFGPARRLLGATYLRAGECARARTTLEEAFAADDTDPLRVAGLAHVLAVSGARARARDLLAHARALRGSRYVSSLHLAMAHVGLDDHDGAFASLEEAWLDRDPAVANVMVDPRFEPLRADARYPEFIERLGPVPLRQ
jgi:tetratricopeptide (TPR) repeat protein